MKLQKKQQKKNRFILCHVPLCQIVQRHVLAADILLLRQLPQHGRFACLPGAGKQDCRVEPAQLQNAAFHMSADVFHNAPPVMLYEIGFSSIGKYVINVVGFFSSECE